MYYDYIETPIGSLELCANDEILLSVLFTETKRNKLEQKEIGKNKILKETAKQLNAFFKNKLQEFDLPIAPEGTTFQQKVWKELCEIPYGNTISYLTLAKRLGDEKCIRAAASANGKNPLAIVVPCHRVIGSNGKLVGYAGDLWRKQSLLDMEGKNSGTLLRLF